MLDKGRLYSGAVFEFMDFSKPDRAVMAKSMSRRPTLQDVADAALFAITRTPSATISTVTVRPTAQVG